MLSAGSAIFHRPWTHCPCGATSRVNNEANGVDSMRSVKQNVHIRNLGEPGECARMPRSRGRVGGDTGGGSQQGEYSREQEVSSSWLYLVSPAHAVSDLLSEEVFSRHKGGSKGNACLCLPEQDFPRGEDTCEELSCTSR